MSVNQRRVDLQRRDFEILKFVFAARVAAFDQIARRSFKGKHKTIAERRIAKLVRGGYLNAGVTLRGGKVRKHYSPTDKCANAVVDQWHFHIDNPHVESESPEHDLRLAELVLKLEGLSRFSMFFPENLLQSSSDLAQDPILADLVKIQSDGALILKREGDEVDVYAVEMEITRKSVERYKDKLASYYLSDSVDGVLYVCGTQEIVGRLAKADEATRGIRKSILHLALEENALAEGKKVIFGNGKVQTLVLS